MMTRSELEDYIRRRLERHVKEYPQFEYKGKTLADLEQIDDCLYYQLGEDQDRSDLLALFLCKRGAMCKCVSVRTYTHFPGAGRLVGDVRLAWYYYNELTLPENEPAETA